VLLIDADLRKPRLHELFGVNQKPGLTDVLTGRVTTAAFQQTAVGPLWLMPAGDVSSNPTDLLGSERFTQLIEHVRGQFDWVVLDSPPVLAVTDPCLIARVASGVLFVVGSGRTSRDAAAAAVERLEAVGVPFVGAVLNRVVLNGRTGSYLPYYHRDYQPAHATDGAGPVASDLPALPIVTEPEAVAPRPRTRRYTAVADPVSDTRNPWDI
jgi:capsular exopolysaccharide synthesis family protein